MREKPNKAKEQERWFVGCCIDKWKEVILVLMVLPNGQTTEFLSSRQKNIIIKAELSLRSNDTYTDTTLEKKADRNKEKGYTGKVYGETNIIAVQSAHTHTNNILYVLFNHTQSNDDLEITVSIHFHTEETLSRNNEWWWCRNSLFDDVYTVCAFRSPYYSLCMAKVSHSRTVNPFFIVRVERNPNSMHTHNIGRSVECFSLCYLRNKAEEVISSIVFVEHNWAKHKREG